MSPHGNVPTASSIQDPLLQLLETQPSTENSPTWEQEIEKEEKEENAEQWNFYGFTLFDILILFVGKTILKVGVFCLFRKYCRRNKGD